MAKRINGRLSRPYVQQKQEFKNSNGQLYAEWLNEPAGGSSRYVVYSYGRHWPLFIWVPRANTWYENAEKYGPTTSKHRTQTHPHCDTVSLTCAQMKILDRLGWSSLVNDRLMGDNANG